MTGLPFQVMATFRSPRTVQEAAEVRRLDETAAICKTALVQALHADVGASGAPGVRNALLATGRNLRRNGKVSAEQEKAVEALGSKAAAGALLAWRAAEADLARAAEALDAVYESERSQCRVALRIAGQEPLFQAGLLAASASLYRNLLAYFQSPDALSENRHRRQLELVLLRYLARAATKTSPFSTFTATALVRSAELSTAEVIRLPGDRAIRSSVALNKVLYGVIGSLIKRTPALYGCFAVTLNPTLHATSSGHAMLVATGGRERIVRLPASAAVSRCLDTIERAGGTLGYAECCAMLAADLGVEPSLLAPRLDRMIDAGLLQLNSGISDQERQWAPILARLLGRSADPLAVHLTEALWELDRVRSQLADAGPAARAELLRTAGACLEALLDKAVASAGPDPGTPAPSPPTDTDVLAQQVRAVKRNAFYEDAALAGPILLNRNRLQPALDVLYDWVDGMSLMALQWGYHSTMREHFNRRYAGRSRVAFLEFYLSFYEEVFEAIVQQARGVPGKSFMEAANPYGLESFQLAMQASDRLYTRIHEVWAADSGAEEIPLSRSDMHGSGLARFRADGPCSAMVFAQLLPEQAGGRGDRLVVDRSLVQRGMGRYYSRFLHLFDGEFTESIRRRNRVPGYLVAELGDDSEFSFNANLHPVVTDREINYPSVLTGLKRDTNLPLADLDVEPHPRLSHRLRLVHRPTATEVCPVDLGFLSHLLRPPLFRVLLFFSPLFHHQIEVPSRNRLLPVTGDGRGGAVRRPRIVYEDRLVLARESWVLSADDFRRQAGSGSPGQVFYRLDEWRRSLGMPSDTFFRLTAESVKPDAAGQGHSPDGLPRSIRRNASKPQYVSFESALLVELLNDAVRQHQGNILFEEMLPRPEMLPRWGPNAHATELVLQVDGEC